MWTNSNIWLLLPLKDKNDHKLCVINKGYFSCVSRYTGET